MFGFHCDVEVVGETIVVFLTECSSKSEECSYSVATEESKLVVIRRGDRPAFGKGSSFHISFIIFTRFKLNHL